MTEERKGRDLTVVGSHAPQFCLWTEITDAAEGLEKKCTCLLTPEKMLGVRSMRMMCSIRIAYRWKMLIARRIVQAVQVDGLSRAVTVA